MSTRETEIPRRADAVRNRERVVAAAEAEFAEHGLDAGIPEIAARAGVGKGTIYRNFESKDELIAAVLTVRLAELDRMIAGARAKEEPFPALRRILRELATRTSGLTIPVGISWPVEHAGLDAARERVKADLAELFNEARAAGEIRADAAPEELSILFGGACRALKAADETDPAIWRRHADLVLDAFRP